MTTKTEVDGSVVKKEEIFWQYSEIHHDLSET